MQETFVLLCQQIVQAQSFSQCLMATNMSNILEQTGVLQI